MTRSKTRYGSPGRGGRHPRGPCCCCSVAVVRDLAVCGAGGLDESAQVWPGRVSILICTTVCMMMSTQARTRPSAIVSEATRPFSPSAPGTPGVGVTPQIRIRIHVVGSPTTHRLPPRRDATRAPPAASLASTAASIVPCS